MRVAYLVSRYPAISHTFIRREIDGLRARGLEIHSFTVRPAEEQELLTARDREDARDTWSILPAPALALLGCHLRALAGRPRRYLGCLAAALRHRRPGLRAALWALFHFVEAIRLAEELEHRRIDHLHTHFANAGGTVGFLASHFLGLPWSLTLHGTADFDEPSLLGEKVAATCFTACVSQFGRAQAMRFCDPAVWPKLFVSRCLVELPPSRGDGAKRRVGRRPRLVSVGRLVPVKGYAGLLQAFARVVEGGMEAELTILGEGPERARLEGLVAELGLEGRVSLPGAASEQRVQEVVGEADLFVLSSFMEGLPVVLLEALALEVPVVAPRVAGVPELVVPGESGALFTPGDFDGLAEEIAKLLREPDELAALGRRGRSRVAAEFTAEIALEPLLRRLRVDAPEPSGAGPAKGR